MADRFEYFLRPSAYELYLLTQISGIVGETRRSDSSCRAAGT
jgi:hypothetical protein